MVVVVVGGWRGNQRGSRQKIRGKSEDGGNKEQPFFGSKQEETKGGGLDFNTTFPSFSESVCY